MKKNSEKKEESKLSKFKEIWSKPRYKALIKLGMYILFFAILFLIAYISSSLNSTDNPTKEKDSTVEILENFEYKYTISTKKGDNIETITYTGTETTATNSGSVEYSYIDRVDNYIVDKVTNKIYINGVEQDKLYELDDESYFSLLSVKDKINKSKKISENEYIYTDENNIKINITLNKTEETQTITIDFNEKYISEIIDGKTLILEYTNIK